MTARQPIAPAYGTGQVVTPAAASATVALTKGSNQLVLTNVGAAVCYVRVGDTGMPAATTADFPVPANTQVTITKAQDQNALSHISAVGTTLHIMNGEGFRG